MNFKLEMLRLMHSYNLQRFQKEGRGGTQKDRNSRGPESSDSPIFAAKIQLGPLQVAPGIPLGVPIQFPILFPPFWGQQLMTHPGIRWLIVSNCNLLWVHIGLAKVVPDPLRLNGGNLGDFVMWQS